MLILLSFGIMGSNEKDTPTCTRFINIPNTNNKRRTGAWINYDSNGNKILEETY